MQFKYWLGKILGPIIGGTIGGFLGVMIGFVIGAILDKLHEDGGYIWHNQSSPTLRDTDPNDFIVGAILLAGSVMKSDGEVQELELSYVRAFLVEQFGTSQMDDYWHILLESTTNDFDLKKTSQQILRTTSYETRLQLIYFLFGIANADFSMKEKEAATIKVISLHLGVHAAEFDSIKAMFVSDIDAYYKILEIAPSASDDAVREAYHSMSKKYHPDKLEHLGDGVKQAGTRKFLKVKEAYESIKKERGFR